MKDYFAKLINVFFTLCLNIILLLTIVFTKVGQSQSFQNLRVSQIEDTLEVHYDIFGGRESDAYKIDMLVSTDGGNTFSIEPKFASGNLGYGQTRGLNKFIWWEPLNESTELVGDNFVVKLTGNVLGTDPDPLFIEIDGGSYTMGDVFKDGPSDEIKLHKVNLSSFEISKYEITNFQYSKFLNEYDNNEVEGGEFDGELMVREVEKGVKYIQGEWQADAGFEYHPVIGVTWYGANEFCKYYGFRLPTEAEWEYVAREKGQKIRFGDGLDTADTRFINFNGAIDTTLNYSSWGENRETTVNVGFFPPNGLEIFQMSGNVWEWCQDWYASDYYFESDSDNPTGPWFGNYKVIRGGSWYDSADGVRTTERSFLPPYYSKKDVGFRVVRTKE